MKFFLLNPDYMIYGDPPVGLAYLASYLREKCSFLDIQIIDQLTDEALFEKIKKEKPEIIGITAVSLNYSRVKKLGEKIKKQFPETILLLGGVHITTSPESFNKSAFDIAVRGEGEITTKNLIISLNKNNRINIEELSKIKGLMFRKGKEIVNTGLGHYIQNLDELPFPARDLLNMKYYTLPRFSSGEDIEPIGSILTSRGCPYSCKFCSSSCFWGRSVRFFSAEKVADEIELLHSKYKYNHIYIYDDLFSINKQRLRKLILILKQKKLLGKIKFSVYGRANGFDEETAQLLDKMNVREITFGFETGSQKILTFLKGTGITIEDGITALKLSKKYNLNPGGFFMIGSPTENEEDFEKTYNFIKNYCRDNFIVYQTLAFPGTDFWAYALKNKILDKDFYEKEQVEFIDTNTDILLSKEIGKKQFEDYFKKIKGLAMKKKNNLIKKLFKIRIRHLKHMLTSEFIKKSFNLRRGFLKRI